MMLSTPSEGLDSGAVSSDGNGEVGRWPDRLDPEQSGTDLFDTGAATQVARCIKQPRQGSSRWDSRSTPRAYLRHMHFPELQQTA